MDIVLLKRTKLENVLIADNLWFAYPTCRKVFNFSLVRGREFQKILLILFCWDPSPNFDFSLLGPVKAKAIRVRLQVRVRVRVQVRVRVRERSWGSFPHPHPHPHPNPNSSKSGGSLISGKILDSRDLSQTQIRVDHGDLCQTRIRIGFAGDTVPNPCPPNPTPSPCPQQFAKSKFKHFGMAFLVCLKDKNLHNWF
jgi:hypothetical protein